MAEEGREYGHTADNDTDGLLGDAEVIVSMGGMGRILS